MTISARQVNIKAFAKSWIIHLLQQTSGFFFGNIPQDMDTYRHLSRLTQSFVQHQTAKTWGQLTAWGREQCDCTASPQDKLCMQGHKAISILFIQSFMITKRSWCWGQITCPLRVWWCTWFVLVSDNGSLINWVFCPLCNYDSGPPLWKQGQLCHITPDLAVLVHTL